MPQVQIGAKNSVAKLRDVGAVLHGEVMVFGLEARGLRFSGIYDIPLKRVRDISLRRDLSFALTWP